MPVFVYYYYYYRIQCEQSLQFSFLLDNLELDAQVPAEVPPGEGQRHPAAPLLYLQNLCV